jgi:hypothetical protein
MRRGIFLKNFQAIIQQLVSAFGTRDKNNELKKKKGINAHTRILVAYVLFNVGLLLPVFIFDIDDAV